MNLSLYSNIHHVLNVQRNYSNDEIQTDFVPWLLWRLWKNRNELLYTGKEFEVGSLVIRAKEDADEWRRRKEVEVAEAESLEAKKTTYNHQRRSWSPPPSQWLKCNSDGAWRKERTTSGLGWVCRDETGTVIWAGARAVTRTRSPIIAEAEALKWGAETMASFGYKRIIFESDSLSLVRMINGTEETWPILRPLIEAIRVSLAQIQSFEVRFSSRGSNKAADRIAKESFTFVSSVPRLYSIVPVWLKYQVRSDKTVYQNNIGE